MSSGWLTVKALRCEGNLLLIGNERAELESQRAESERQRADFAQSQLRECALNLLREGMDVEQVARMTGLELEVVCAIVAE